MEDGQEFSDEAKAMLAIVEIPAYLRRAQRVEMEQERIRQKVEIIVRQGSFQLRISMKAWNRLVSDHEQIQSEMSKEASSVIASINRTLFLPNERQLAPASVGRPGVAHRKWEELKYAVAEFNNRWPQLLTAIRLDDLNSAIDGYNRFYVFEKECAVKSPHTARMGFSPMPLVSATDLVVQFPPLPELPDDFRPSKEIDR